MISKLRSRALEIHLRPWKFQAPSSIQPSNYSFEKCSTLTLFSMASGDLETDAYPVRLFAENQVPLIVTQSFSKNMGLYGQRAGLISVLADSPKFVKNIEMQILNISRQLWGMVPIHGARQAAIVMSTPELNSLWKQVGSSSPVYAALRHLRFFIPLNKKDV